MEKERLKSLTREFESACADEKEAQEFALFATNLSNAFKQTRSDELKNNFLKQIKPPNLTPFKYQFLIPVILAFTIVFGFAYKVQASKDGEFLYPVKVLSARVYSDAKEALSLSSFQSGNANIKNAKPVEVIQNSAEKGIKNNTASDNSGGKSNADIPETSHKTDFIEDTSQNIQDVKNSINNTVLGDPTNDPSKVDKLDEKVDELTPPTINLPQNSLGL